MPTDAPAQIAVGPQSDPHIEVGQLPDERQFLAALLKGDAGWMTVVHFFASEGDHLDTDCSEPLGEGDEPPAEARDAFETALRRLEPYKSTP